MTEKRQVYIVTGETGEYSDHTLWYVSAYDSEPDARAVADALNAKLRERGLMYDQDGPRPSWQERRPAVEEMKVYDPEISVDYTGSNYDVITVPFDAVNRSLLTAPAASAREEG